MLSLNTQAQVLEDFSRKEAHCLSHQGFSIEGTGPQSPEHLCDNPKPLIIHHITSTDFCCHASHAHAYVGGHAHTRTRTGLGEALFETHWEGPATDR